MLRHASLVIVVALTAACAATNSNVKPLAYSFSANVLTAAEMVASHVSDAYQAVNQLRPEFLRRRYLSPVEGVSASYGVTVYLDDMLIGDAESLRSVALSEVRIIRYLPPMEADMRFGGQHPAGAILVTTIR